MAVAIDHRHLRPDVYGQEFDDSSFALNDRTHIRATPDLGQIPDQELHIGQGKFTPAQTVEWARQLETLARQLGSAQRKPLD